VVQQDVAAIDQGVFASGQGIAYEPWKNWREGTKSGYLAGVAEISLIPFGAQIRQTLDAVDCAVSGWEPTTTNRNQERTKQPHAQRDFLPRPVTQFATKADFIYHMGPDWITIADTGRASARLPTI
jgi:hypothetical protein